jgi:hypothetical protein
MDEEKLHIDGVSLLTLLWSTHDTIACYAPLRPTTTRSLQAFNLNVCYFISMFLFYAIGVGNQNTRTVLRSRMPDGDVKTGLFNNSNFTRLSKP